MNIDKINSSVKLIVKCQTGYGSDSVLLENTMVMKNEIFGKTKEELENVIVDVAMELFCLDANLFFLSVDWDSISVKHSDDDVFETTSSNSFVSLCSSSSNLSSILAVKLTLVCESVALDHSFRISLFREFLWFSISSQDNFNSVLKVFDDSFGVDNKDLCQKFLDDSNLRFDHFSFGDARVFNCNIFCNIYKMSSRRMSKPTIFSQPLIAQLKNKKIKKFIKL